MDIVRIANQIAIWRREKGLTQEQLAERINVSPQAVSKWENAKSLPETESIILLAKALGCSIDSLLNPQELQIISAQYTDGLEQIDCTQLLGRFTEHNALSLYISERTLPVSINGNRIKLLIVKYQTPDGVYYTYALNNSQLVISSLTKGYTPIEKGLEFVYASYGNETAHNDVIQKLKHYDYFKWSGYQINHETFPSPPENDGLDYLTLVYLNNTGMHCISGTDGEELKRSENNGLLYVHNTHKGRILPDIGLLGFGKDMECSWAGALYTALKYMGVETTYERVMGVSGACWRIAFTPVWDYSSVDGLVSYDYATPAYKAFGFGQPVWANRISKEERADERQKIADDINNGKPPIAINLRVAPEWGVITGYTEHGKKLLCRTYYDEEIFAQKWESEAEAKSFAEEMKKTGGYLYADNWPFAIAHFSDRTQASEPWECLCASLNIKLDSMSIEKNRGYFMGYAALSAWRDGLLDTKWYEKAKDEEFQRRVSVNHFQMLSLADARRCAAVYLTECSELCDGQKREMLAAMAGMYQTISVKLKALFNILPCDQTVDFRTAWTDGLRREQAALLDELMSVEHQADELARQILE